MLGSSLNGPRKLERVQEVKFGREGEGLKVGGKGWVLTTLYQVELIKLKGVYTGILCIY